MQQDTTAITMVLVFSAEGNKIQQPFYIYIFFVYEPAQRSTPEYKQISQGDYKCKFNQKS